MNNIDALGLTILPDGCRERPEPVSDPEEVCPEFSHTGYCPDRLCERGCKHEAVWKVGDRVEHTIHGIGTIIDHLTAAKDRPYRVRFDQAWGWFEAGDIQEAPPERSEGEEGWVAVWRDHFAEKAAAPPVSDTVMVELPRWVAEKAARALDTPTMKADRYAIDLIVGTSCRSALTAEAER